MVGGWGRNTSAADIEENTRVMAIIEKYRGEEFRRTFIGSTD